jgi:hypothetical protein
MPHTGDPCRTLPLRWRVTSLRRVAACLGVAILASGAAAQTQGPAVSVTLGPDGRLAYTSDSNGTRTVDFSFAGYEGGGKALPSVPVRVVVPASTGWSPGSSDPGSKDPGLHGGRRDRERIQAAIDLVSSLPPDAAGFRGAVLLEKGRFVIDTDLRISASGVVLRGSGSGEDGTVLVAAGTSRRSLITVSGQGERQEQTGSRTLVADSYVPAGARTLTVGNAGTLAVGDAVIVGRPSTAEWITSLGMNTFAGWRPENRLHWQPGSRDLVWDRIVTAVDGNRITVDAPITTALDRQYGGGWVTRFDFPGRISHVGVEGLRLESAYDTTRPLDEDHAWVAITLDKVEHAWVRQVSARHFASYVINVEADAKWVTVMDVDAAEPVSEIGGYRRRVFYTAGQMTLFRRCLSSQGTHDFVVGFAAAGPNVFLECASHDALDYSGPLESWSSGVLYDSVTMRGNGIRFTNRGTSDQGQGWTTANSVLWNCDVTDVEVQSPPGAINQAYGCKGMVTGDGMVWDARTMPYRDFYRGSPVRPASLYLAQLAERLGSAAVLAIETPLKATSSTDVRRLAQGDVDAFVARERAAMGLPGPGPLRVHGGMFTIGGEPAWTARTGWSWFQGQMPRTLAQSFGPALTRFAPGKTGLGATDDLEEVAARMAPRSVFYQHYGLWYDRRRVDHNYYGSPEQRTGDVWAPFMELPWSRSGQGKAWDGLSKYDLTRFNPWYFDRVRGFADIADRKGLVLYHNFYFQHWVLESRSHYVDFPWRPVNTIQNTGLPDENPAANVFWDISDPLRRDLHRLYIRHALDNLKDNTNVVHGIDREYTGSIEFVRFWLDTMAEWHAERGRPLFICLEIPKDQMDAILDDPVRGKMITAIDVLSWVYRADGRLYAVKGSLNRAPREQRPDIATPTELEVLKKKLGITALDQRDFVNGPEFQRLFNDLWASSKPMKYRAWREYRDRYPQLVVLWKGDEYPGLTSAVEKLIPTAVRTSMRPADLVRSNADTAWCVANPGSDYLVYTVAGLPVSIDLSKDTISYRVAWLDEVTGVLQQPGEKLQGGRIVTLTPPAAGTGRAWAAWLSVERGR